MDNRRRPSLANPLIALAIPLADDRLPPISTTSLTARAILRRDETETVMDWTAAIERHREALRRAVELIAARAGLREWSVGGRRSGWGPFTRFPAEGAASEASIARETGKLSPRSATPLTLPRHLHRIVLKLVFAAEAAARRLVVAAARGMIVPARPLARLPVPALPVPGSTCVVTVPVASLGLARAAPPPARPRDPFRPLPLLDPLRGLPRGRPWSGMARTVPRIVVMDADARAVRLPSPTDPIDATRLALRLAAVADVLDDLPRHALRLARWKGRRDAARAAGRPHRFRPLRPGPPPAWRRRAIHPVHAVLDDVHGLAHWALDLPDTS